MGYRSTKRTYDIDIEPFALSPVYISMFPTSTVRKMLQIAVDVDVNGVYSPETMEGSCCHMGWPTVIAVSGSLVR